MCKKELQHRILVFPILSKNHFDNNTYVFTVHEVTFEKMKKVFLHEWHRHYLTTDVFMLIINNNITQM